MEEKTPTQTKGANMTFIEKQSKDLNLGDEILVADRFHKFNLETVSGLSAIQDEVTVKTTVGTEMFCHPKVKKFLVRKN